jgi:hypothetical protein
MKVSAVAFTLTYLCATSLADRMIRVVFNKGKLLSTNQSCTQNDNVLIDKIFSVNTSSYRRNLRSFDHENEIRRLAPIYCKNNCKGYVEGTCRATNCLGYRRKLTTTNPIVDTINNITCSAQVQLLNATLNTLVSTNAVTSTCKKFLNTPRNFSCYDDVMYGVIEYIRVVDNKNETLYDDEDSDNDDVKLSICKSVPFRIIVEVNSCVDNLESKYSGPLGNYTIPTSKFPFLFVISSFALLFPGNYTMQYIPDGFISKSKTLKLELRKC